MRLYLKKPYMNFKMRKFRVKKKMTMSEVDSWYRRRRLKEYGRKGHCVSCVRLHAFFHRLLLPLMIIDRKSNGYKVVIVKDLRTAAKRKIIYCPTHIGGMDIQIAAELAKEPCFIMIGDPRELYKSVAGTLLKLNGWIPLDTKDKMDRRIAAASMEEVLKRGGNVLMFPEGTQNANPSLLLNHLYMGAVKAAVASQAEIVPIAMERVGKTYYCAISYAKKSAKDAVLLTTELRDEIATLKWSVLEQVPPCKRSEVSAEEFQKYVDEILNVGAEYTMTLDEVRAGEFHPKDEVGPEETYEFMKHLIPNSRNAFLMRRD